MKLVARFDDDNFFCLKNNLLAMGHFDLMMNLMCEEATKVYLS